jgi:hypothetical protein
VIVGSGTGFVVGGAEFEVSVSEHPVAMRSSARSEARSGRMKPIVTGLGGTGTATCEVACSSEVHLSPDLAATVGLVDAGPKGYLDGLAGDSERE